MKKTTKRILEMTSMIAILASASCEKLLSPDNTNSCIPDSDKYEIVIKKYGGFQLEGTAGVLGMKDETRSGQYFKAELFKNGEIYTGHVDWDWEKTGAYYETTIRTDSDKSTVDLYSKMPGCGKGMTAIARIEGKKIAVSEEAEVIVTDDREHAYICPKTVTLNMRIKRDWSRTGELSICPSIQICDREEFEIEPKKVDMTSAKSMVYLTWTFDTIDKEDLDETTRDLYCDRDCSDFSWWAYLKDIVIMSENGYLNGNYKYSVNYGTYASDLQQFTTSGGIGNSYKELRWGDYYNKFDTETDHSKEGRGKKSCNPITENNYAVSLISSGINGIRWDEYPEENLNLYVDLDLSEAGCKGQ